MEQLVLLLIIAAISFINWLLQRSAELREKRKAQGKTPPPVFQPIPSNPQNQTPPPIPTPPPEPDPEEAMRRLMEALGIPIEQEPPSSPIPQTPAEPQQPHPQPTRTYQHQPTPVSNFETFAQAPPPVPPEFPQTQPQATSSQDWTQAFRQRRLADQAAIAQQVTKKKNRFKDLLLNPSGFRDAIVLSEVLGKPVALRQANNQPGFPLA